MAEWTGQPSLPGRLRCRLPRSVGKKRKKFWLVELPRRCRLRCPLFLPGYLGRVAPGAVEARAANDLAAFIREIHEQWWLLAFHIGERASRWHHRQGRPGAVVLNQTRPAK